MRICSPHCGLAPNSGSGGEVYERELLSAVARQGLAEIHLPMPTGKVVPDVLSQCVEPRRPQRGWHWWLAPLFAVPAIRQCWHQHGFDVLRAHSARFMGPACHLARGARRVPLVVHHHHFDGIWQERVDMAALRRADLVTTDSAASVRGLAARGITSRVVVVPPGVGQEFFLVPGRRGGGLRGFRDGGPVATLLFLGELKARKNPVALPRILRAVLDRGGMAELVIVGDGPQRPEVARESRRLRVDAGTHFLGRVPDGDRLGYYAAADVFVFPSSREGFGMPVLEAMASGTPVVASKVGAIPELVEDGRTGFLVADPDDVGAFADRIVELLRSAALRREMGPRARAEASRWSWGRSAQRLAGFYRELC